MVEIEPQKPLVDFIDAGRYARQTKKFIEHYLHGIATVSVGEIDNGTITVCTYYSAYAIKQIVMNVDSDDEIAFHMSAELGKFTLTAEYTGGLNEGAEDKISKAADTAGWHAEFKEGKIELVTKHRFSEYLELYDRSNSIVYTDLYYMFFGRPVYGEMREPYKG